MDQNHEAFDKQGIKVVQAYLQGSIDEKLSARLATMRNDEGRKKKITEETAITTIFGHLEELYLDVKPHWVQRMDFFRTNQGSHEKFKSDEPAKRLWMKTASRDGMNSDEIDVLELIRGAHSDKLRKEMLIEKDPRPIS